MQDIAVGRNHRTILIELERARARVHKLAVHIHLKEAIAFNGHVQRVASILKVALCKKLVYSRGASTHADLYAHGQAVVTLGDSASHAHGLVHKIFKLGPALFEPRGVDVGQVVGNHVDIELLGHHAGGACPKRSHHGNFSLY